MKEHEINNVLVFDIETTSRDVKTTTCKVWGAYSFKDKKFYYGYEQDKELLQQLFYDHKFIVGHNIEDFDIPIIQRQYQVDTRYNKLIDTLIILRERDVTGTIKGKGRVQIIGEFLNSGLVSNMPPSLGLRDLIPHCHEIFKGTNYEQFFGEYKDELDYSLLQQDIISTNDWKLILKYLEQDLIVTKNLYLFMEEYFDGFREYLAQKDQDDKCYVMSSTASLAYKTWCNILKLDEIYNDKIPYSFEGAFVMNPIKEKYGPEYGDGSIRDFASQHPHHVYCGNLFCQSKDCPKAVNNRCPKEWSGGKVFKLKGKYCGCTMDPRSKLLRYFYFLRQFYKRKVTLVHGITKKFSKLVIGEQYLMPNNISLNLDVINVNEDTLKELKDLEKQGVDKREYTLKILINTGGYGAPSSSVFTSIHNDTLGEDTTAMSRQSTSFMTDWCRSVGYDVVYGDTDSIYVYDPYKNPKALEAHLKKGIQQLKDCLPFIDDTYDMGNDGEFTHIFFFKDDELDLQYKKKNYIYITKPDEKNPLGKLKVKGLGIIKRNCPKLAKKIVTDYLESRILKEKEIKFPKQEIQQLLEFEINKDITILATKFNLKPYETYKSKTALVAQLSKFYGDGVKYFIKNKAGIGIGGGVKYCLLFDEHGNIIPETKKLRYKDMDLDTVWSTLDPFIKKETKQNRLW